MQGILLDLATVTVPTPTVATTVLYFSPVLRAARVGTILINSTPVAPANDADFKNVCSKFWSLIFIGL